VQKFNKLSKYEGFDKSEALVMETIFPTKTTCNFDIIVGHSQGAILTAALLSTQIRLRDLEHGPLGYILNGVAWPNPLSNSLLSLAQEPVATDLLPKIAFVMGKADTINPIESAVRVYDSYKAAGFDVSIVHHEAGHSVPQGNDVDSIRALNEVVNWIIDIAKEKAEKSKSEA
jgi:predicted esterase